MSARTGGMILAAAAARPRARRRPRRPRPRRPDQRGVDRPVGRAPARPRRRRCGSARPVDGLDCTGRVGGSRRATVAGRAIEADHYVAALPGRAAAAARLAAELRAAEPRLGGLDRLVTRWMNGVMFYLDSDVPLVNGHAIYIDSEWALTSISQAQFWPGVDLARHGDGACAASSRSTSRSGSARAGGPARSAPSARPRRSAPRCGAAQGPPRRRPDGARRRESDRWFLDPAIVFPNPTGRRTSSRCWSTPPARGPTGPRRDAHPQPLPGLGLRAHPHRPGDDGGRQRGRPPRGQRDPRRHRLECPPLRRVAAAGAAGFAAARALDRVRWKLFRRPAKPPLELSDSRRAAPDGAAGSRGAARADAAATRVTQRRREAAFRQLECIRRLPKRQEMQRARSRGAGAERTTWQKFLR